MDTSCTLQIFIDGAWHDAGALSLIGDTARGLACPSYLSYTVEHAVAYGGRIDAAALSANLPVGFDDVQAPAWPSFLVDLLPQGYGRVELLRQLGLPERAEAVADWPLLCAGAGNSIGNLRIRQAWEWAQTRSADGVVGAAGAVGATRGFTADEIAARSEDFNEYLAQHGLFLAGSSGLQGEWPKILMTRAHDGLFYLDHALPDHQAQQHFIIKFGRGQDQALADILRLEAPYMVLAQGLGLQVHAALELRGRALFIPRFDRAVTNAKVLRHAQESIASLCGIDGFGRVPSHNEACAHLGRVATDPLHEVIEYMKRDIANVALHNKDNHARNTAIQRRADGHVGLTPLFDFAPMWLHPDGIARRMRWAHDDGGSPRWSSAIAQAAEAADVDVVVLTQAIKPMAGAVAALPEQARASGIEERFIAPLLATIRNVQAQLEAL